MRLKTPWCKARVNPIGKADSLPLSARPGKGPRVSLIWSPFRRWTAMFAFERASRMSTFAYWNFTNMARDAPLRRPKPPLTRLNFGRLPLVSTNLRATTMFPRLKALGKLPAETSARHDGGAGRLGFRLNSSLEGQVREKTLMRQIPRWYTAGQNPGRVLRIG